MNTAPFACRRVSGRAHPASGGDSYGDDVNGREGRRLDRASRCVGGGRGINIDFNRDNTLSEQASKLLKDYYCIESEDSPQQAFGRAAVGYAYGDMELGQRIYEYVSKGWFMVASPVLSNAPMPGQKVKALPISCFLTYVPDSLEGLIDHTAELRWLSVKGGGVGGHWSDIRAVSDKAPGPMPFLHTVDADMTAYRQGKTRKGSWMNYLWPSKIHLGTCLVSI